MALTFETIQPIKLDGKTCTPVVDAEARLRLSMLKGFNTESEVKKAAEIISECFPNEKEYVAGKVLGLTPMDLDELRTYLVGGYSAIKRLTETYTHQIDKLMSERMNRAVAAQGEANEQGA